jgi:mannosyltransferase
MNEYGKATTGANPIALPRLRPGAPALFGLLALLALAGAAYGRAAFPFWPDEAYSVLEARAHDWTELLVINLRNEQTPPLYFALLRLWALAWGDSGEATLRLFSAICLALTVPLAGWLGWRLWSRRVGIVAALLLAVNPLLHYYGAEARAYTLAVLFVTVLLLAAHGYRRRPGPRAWAVYILAGTAAIYTNYFTVFVLAGAGGLVGLLLAIELWRERGRRQLAALAGWLMAQALILAMLLPWLPGVRYQMLASQATLAAEGRNIWLQLVLAVLALGGSQPDGSPISVALIVLIAIGLLVAAVVALGWGTAEQRAWLLCTIGLPMLCVMFVFGGDGQFNARYLLPVLPAYVVLLAAGLTRPGRWQRAGQVILAAVVVLSAVYCFSARPNVRRLGGWDTIARQVEAQAQSGDALFFAPPWAQAAFTVQYRGAPLPSYGATSFAEYYLDQGHPFSRTLEIEALQHQVRSGRRAWIVWDHVYAQRPEMAGATIQEYRYGSTSLLLVTPAGGAQ